MSVQNAHNLCDSIETELNKKIKFLDTNIHIEPSHETP